MENKKRTKRNVAEQIAMAFNEHKDADRVHEEIAAWHEEDDSESQYAMREMYTHVTQQVKFLQERPLRGFVTQLIAKVFPLIPDEGLKAQLVDMVTSERPVNWDMTLLRANIEAHQAFSLLDIYPAWITSFKMPVDVAASANRAQAASLLTKHTETNMKNFTWERVEQLIKTAESILRLASINPVSQSYNALVALRLLIGRRLAEMMEQCQMLEVVGEHRLRTPYLGKKRRGTIQWHEFPTLCDAHLCKEVLEKIRPIIKQRKPTVTGRNQGGVKRYKPNYSKSSIQASERIFGENLDHSVSRGLYALVAYEWRDKLGFCRDLSLPAFGQQALCHEKMGEFCVYNRIKIEGTSTFAKEAKSRELIRKALEHAGVDY